MVPGGYSTGGGAAEGFHFSEGEAYGDDGQADAQQHGQDGRPEQQLVRVGGGAEEGHSQEDRDHGDQKEAGENREHKALVFRFLQIDGGGLGAHQRSFRIS